MSRSPDVVRNSAPIGDDHRVSAYILGIHAVLLGDTAAVGYGVDERGRGFAVALALGLAAEVATALKSGRRPIVAVETPLYPLTNEARGVFDQRDVVELQDPEGPEAQPGGVA